VEKRSIRSSDASCHASMGEVPTKQYDIEVKRHSGGRGTTGKNCCGGHHYGMKEQRKAVGEPGTGQRLSQPGLCLEKDGQNTTRSIK